ncbi:hypothetical protein, partial [Burkholderia cepacia]
SSSRKFEAISPATSEVGPLISVSLVCGHPFKRIFSRAEKSFSRADGIHIHTFTPEIRFSPR